MRSRHTSRIMSVNSGEMGVSSRTSVSMGSAGNEDGHTDNPLLDPLGGSASVSSATSRNSNVRSWDSQIAKLQQASNIIAHVLAFASVALVTLWISNLGGLSWKPGEAKKVFNWHPLLMIAAFAFMTVAALSFRFPYDVGNRAMRKLLHGMAWTVAFLSALVALIAVFKSHNDPQSGYIANLYSLHSWVGVAVILLYSIQFFMGIFSFVWPLPSVTPAVKAKVMSFHRFMGPFVYNCSAATILLGIQEKEGFIGCSYSVNEADLFPPKHIMDIPASCRISHTLGIVVLCLALFTSFALHEFTNKRPGGNQSPVQPGDHIL